MKLLKANLPSDHNIFLFGDRHDGSVLSSKSGWNTLINMMHSRYDGCINNYGMEGGDMIEAIAVDDSRFDPEKMTQPLPLEQAEMAIKDREPIKKMLLSILMGNHERKLWRFGDLARYIANKLEVPYGTYSCKMTILDKNDNLMHKIFDTHGSRGINSTADDPIRREANMELTLKRHLKYKAGDCAIMIKHHAHKLVVAKPRSELYVTDNGKKIRQHYTNWGQSEEYIHPDARWFGCAGSFLRLFGEGFSGYAEVFELDPTQLGFLILKVRKKKIVDLEPYFIKH